MARISKDSTSWRAYGLAKRNEDWENNPKRQPVKAKKKNTKRWCKGKVGVEHNFESTLVVQTNPKCFTGVFCGHWFHYQNACTGCGKEDWGRDERKGIDRERQEELAAKWCTEDHLWDWSEFEHKEMYTFVNGELKEVYNHSFVRPWRHPKVHKVCVMCGLERRSQTRKIGPEDLK